MLIEGNELGPCGLPFVSLIAVLRLNCRRTTLNSGLMDAGSTSRISGGSMRTIAIRSSWRTMVWSVVAFVSWKKMQLFTFAPTFFLVDSGLCWLRYYLWLTIMVVEWNIMVMKSWVRQTKLYLVALMGFKEKGVLVTCKSTKRLAALL